MKSDSNNFAASCIPPPVLAIAGSDPSGGAGVQADLKTFTALQCYGMSVITSLTSQNTLGVSGVQSIPPDFVKRQMTSVLSDIPAKAIKTGMLFNEATAKTVANTLREAYAGGLGPNETKTIPPTVVDPVCVSTSGHTLLHQSALQVLIEELFPIATLITPNKAEAELLLAAAAAIEAGAKLAEGDFDIEKYKKELRDLQEVTDAARQLVRVAQSSVLLKGGHLTVRPVSVRSFARSSPSIRIEWGDSWEQNMEILRIGSLGDSEKRELVVDVLIERGSLNTTLFVRPRIDSRSTHGTGCTLSAAIACFLAKEHSLLESVRLGIEYTHLGIQTAFPIGQGFGPLNHLHSVMPRLVPLATNHDPFPFTRAMILSDTKLWKEYVEHPFVRQLGAGTLKKENFIHFIKQDYKYLKYYARAYGLVTAKSRDYAGINGTADIIKNVIREVESQKITCFEWGVTVEDIEKTPESLATSAYGGYLLDVGIHGDETKLLISLAACLLGYGEVGLWLLAESKREGSWVKLEGNPYRRWIEDYSGPEYQSAVKLGLDVLETAARTDPPSLKRLEEWKEVWNRCTTLERGFWDMALNLA